MTDTPTSGPVPGQPNTKQPEQPPQTVHFVLPGMPFPQQPVANPAVGGPFDSIIEIGAFPGAIQFLFKPAGAWMRIPCHMVNALLAQIEAAKDCAAVMASVSAQGTKAAPAIKRPPPREKGDA